MIYLHHYEASLFSEKVRALLGYLDLSWQSVIIPTIMPRPLLMPLTGGYRKTPCLQIDANVYCDTAVIARALAREAGDETLFAQGFAASRVAEWADSQLFRVTVALNFRPEALGPMMNRLSEAEVTAFQKDRAELTKGAPMVSYSVEAALAFLSSYLDELERTLERGGPFLFGATPCIADFSVYHCLWFLRSNPANAALLDGHAAVLSWYERIRGFGHGTVAATTGEAALAAAMGAEPATPALPGPVPKPLQLGDRITVMPVDYGLVAVAGQLVAIDVDEVVIARQTPETGTVHVHFPRAGFELLAVADS
ncbi:MAG: glutathione S-transferase family protein [Pseudomonadota bacterium]